MQLSSKTLGGLVDFSDIQLTKFLGDGSYGSVHQARWKHVPVSTRCHSFTSTPNCSVGLCGWGGLH